MKDTSVSVRQTAVEQLWELKRDSEWLSGSIVDRLQETTNDISEDTHVRETALFILCACKSKPQNGLADLLLKWLEEGGPGATINGADHHIDLERGIKALKELARRDPRAECMLIQLQYSGNQTLAQLAKKSGWGWHPNKAQFLKDIIGGKAIVLVGPNAVTLAQQDLATLEQEEMNRADYRDKERSDELKRNLEESKLWAEVPKREEAIRRLNKKHGMYETGMNKKHEHSITDDVSVWGEAMQPILRRQAGNTIEGMLDLQREDRKASTWAVSSPSRELEIVLEMREVEREQETKKERGILADWFADETYLRMLVHAAKGQSAKDQARTLSNALFNAMSQNATRDIESSAQFQEALTMLENLSAIDRGSRMTLSSARIQAALEQTKTRIGTILRKTTVAD